MSVTLGPDQSAGVGDDVAFSAAIDNADPNETYTINWDFGDGGTADGSLDATHAYADVGSYTVTVSVTDSHGGTGSATQTVTVADAPAEPQTVTITVKGGKVTLNQRNGQTTVQIGNRSFDGSQIDISTVRFGVAGTEASGTQSGKIKKGTLTLVFSTADLGITPEVVSGGRVTLVMIGNLKDGTPFVGTTEVKVMGLR